MDNEEPGMLRIPLDGTYGAGPEAELTIITKTEDGRMKETSYTIPYLCLDMTRIQRFSDVNLIAGFKIVKFNGKATAGLRELGLS